MAAEYFHVRISRRSNKTHDEVGLDLSRDQLEARILRPYRDGRPIVLGGTSISPDDLTRVRITVTQQPSQQIMPVVIAEERASNVITSIPFDWLVADKGRDVTDELIDAPPGTGLRGRGNSEGPGVQGAKVVFVVHGRDQRLRDSLFTFLRAIGLHPLEWSEAIVATGQTTPYIRDVLNKAFEIAQAVIVLLTPDDEARLRADLRAATDPPHETNLTGQARPNVLFEAGMAMGRTSDQTVLVQVGELRPFSDVSGIHVVHLSNTSQSRQQLAQRLEIAGCPVDLTGTDWHSAGDFSAPDAVKAAESPDDRKSSQVKSPSARSAIGVRAKSDQARRERLREAVGVMEEGLTTVADFPSSATSYVQVQQAISELSLEGPMAELKPHLEAVEKALINRTVKMGDVRRLMQPIIEVVRRTLED